MSNREHANPMGREPVGMTQLDRLALAAGIALAYAFWESLNPFRGTPFLFVRIPGWVILIWLTISLLLALDLATSLAILARRFRYGGPPRSADWLALTPAAALLAQALPNVDEAVNLVYRIRGNTSLDFGLLRWGWAGVAVVIALAALVALGLGRKWLSAGLKTILLLVVAMALSWGPLPVCEREIPWLITLHPSQPPPSAGQLSFWLGVEVREAIGRLPTSLLFGVPIVVAFLDFRRADRPSWTWTEWVGSCTAALLAALMLISPIMNLVMFAPRADGIAEWVGWILQLIATTLLAWAIVRGLGPTWNRWIGAGYDRIEAR